MSELDVRETVVSTQSIYDGAIIHVEKWQVTLPDGRPAQREVVRHGGAVAVVPVDARGYVTLVRQHRVVIDTVTFELPAGKLDYPGEDPLSAAQRELSEETGFTARSWRLLTHAVSTPGYCTERIAIYLATDLTRHAAHTDEDEFLSVASIPLAEAVERVMRGEFEDMKTSLGILMANHVLGLTRHMPVQDALPGIHQQPRYPRAEGLDS